MTFDGVSKESQASFTYQLNPEIIAVTPMTSIQAGGRKLQVRGDRLDTVQRPIIFVVLDTGDLSTAFCSIYNSTFMECPTPTVNTVNKNTTEKQKRHTSEQLEQIAEDVIGSLDDLLKVIEKKTKNYFIQQDQDASGNRAFSDDDMRLPIGFIMDGVQDLLRWSDYSQVYMKYHDNPEYDTFTNGKKTLSGTVLQIYGKNLKLASSEEDVEVLIGSGACEVTALVDNSLTCTAPDKQPPGYDENGSPSTDILPRVKVRHGNYVKDLGQLKYHDTSVPTWVKVFLGIFFPGAILIVIVVLIFVMWWYRKTRTQYEIVQNREEELLDQIRSLKNALSLQDHRGRPLSHVTLSNNVRIDQKDVSVSFDQLKYQHELGKGAFGKVFQALLNLPDQHFNRTVAVKTVRDDADPGTTLKFLEEGLLMKKFIHPNIMALIGLAFDLKNNPVIVLPLMIHGDLKSYLRKETTIVNGRQLVNFALDVAYGMVYLADRKFVHRDLAARNCMVSENLVVKVADFGLSRDVHETDIYRMKETRKLPVKWMAIENLDRKIFTSKSDVWSYGVLFWEIFTRGDLPYSKIENKDLYYYLVDGHRLECPEYCPKQIYEVMFDCWKDEADDRPSFPDIVSSLTCILDSNDPADVENVDADVPDIPEEDEAILHHNPTYLEPMDMMPAMPPPAPPTYVNDDPDEDVKDETTC
ncbi:uncharacterized protein [Amphiura filiformis]|uniref:uncharacterized protein n=1 Tax=Amphiura filiformis TaxID=82378 RepID=UPI003B225D5E